ncbi:MAG: cell division protein FtsA, partial [Lachnospiraceae bacterium]|nr:cell division protein FtsA [Lachnospiraceae bacterium]
MGGVKSQGQLVFGLDIGTRSIVGTVGYKADDGFHVLAQEIKEHESRAMLDGQIHDIGKVGDTIRDVKKKLEDRLGKKLGEVCIAAAGRVLRTVTVNVTSDFEAEKEVTDEDIYNLSMSGIELAYSEFQSANDTDMKFYCVGYTPMRYYLNGYQMGNLEGHKAKKIAADLIATFLPDDVVDGLYKAVEHAGLHVANLTLEPIAAIQVAIPDKFRLLNLALVDVGAGTSDISITRDGSIVA